MGKVLLAVHLAACTRACGLLGETPIFSALPQRAEPGRSHGEF